MFFWKSCHLCQKQIAWLFPSEIIVWKIIHLSMCQGGRAFSVSWSSSSRGSLGGPSGKPRTHPLTGRIGAHLAFYSHADPQWDGPQVTRSTLLRRQTPGFATPSSSCLVPSFIRFTENFCPEKLSHEYTLMKLVKYASADQKSKFVFEQ